MKRWIKRNYPVFSRKLKNYFNRIIFRHIRNFIINKNQMPPEGFYLSDEEYFAEKNIRLNKTIIRSETSLTPQKPINSELFTNIKELVFPENYFVKIPNGSVWGREGVPIADTNKVMDNINLSFTRHVRPISEHEIFSELILPKPVELSGNVALLSTMWSDFYYHWICDLLPKFDFVEKSGINFDYFIINGSKTKFQTESLKMLGIHEEKLIWLDEKSHMKAENLYVFSIPDSMEYKSEATIDTLQKFFINEATLDSSYPEKIYISRRKANSRRFINEDEVLKLLIDNDYKEIFLEELDFKEQIKCFYNAKSIISAHGGGLTNLVFSQKNSTTLIEIFSEVHIIPCYWAIANSMKLKYFCLKGLSFEKNKKNREDILVDIAQLEGVLSQI